MKAAFLLLLLAIPAVTGATLRFQEGVARSPDSHQVLYREQHWIRDEAGRSSERLVLYLCPNGTVFGRKHVDYRASASAPDFRFEDARTGYLEGFKRGPGLRVFVRPGAQAPEQAAALAGTNLVADAGFDEFIRKHWAALASGQSLPLSFVVPARLESLGFSVRRVAQAQVNGEQAWIFRLRLGSLLGWLLPHFDVSYGQQSRRLLRFEGLSNLRDAAGKNQLTTTIDFPLSAQPVAEAQWQSALQAPLQACVIGH